MQTYGIDTTLANDGDFDDVGVRRIPRRAK
jgi:predicted nucleic acid-binding protein